MTIPTPPPAPNPNDPATFNSRAAALAAWYGPAVIAWNNLAIIGDGNAYLVQANAIDATNNRILRINGTEGAFGWGARQSPPLLPGFNAVNLADGTAVPSGLYRYTSATPNNASLPAALVGTSGMCIFYRFSNNTFMQMVFRGTGTGGFHYRVHNGSAFEAWRTFRDTTNTTIDGNGFVKVASPIIRVMADGHEEPVQTMDASWERLGEGVYRLTGVPPLATKGWTYEVPRDAGGPLCLLRTEYFPADQALVVRTYAPRHRDGELVRGRPLDVPAGRWVDLRFWEPEAEGETPPAMPEVSAEDFAAQRLQARRETTSLSRIEFCLACMAAGLLNGDEAEQAAGGAIPASFAPIIAAMPAPQAAEARIRWAGLRRVDRLDPFIAVTAAHQHDPDAVLDAIFGVDDA